MKQLHPLSKIALTFGISIIHIVLFTILATTIGVTVFNIDITEISSYLNKVEDKQVLNALRIFQMCYTIGGFFMAAYFAAKLFSDRPVNYLSADKSPALKWVIVTIAIAFTVLPFVSFLGVLNYNIPFPESMEAMRDSFVAAEEKNERLILGFLKMDGIGSFVLNLLMIAVLPAIAEEFMFRGLIQRQFVQWLKNEHLGVLATATVFSLIHYSFFGFLPRLALGILFGYLLIWSKSIWVPIVAHFINNGFAVVSVYILGPEFIDNDVESFGSSNDWMMTIGSIVVTSGLIYLLFKWRDLNSTIAPVIEPETEE